MNSSNLVRPSNCILVTILGLLGFQWILDELRHLRKLFLKNVRRLLHLLSRAAHNVYAQVLGLLKKCYKLLFTDTPARVHKAMVDFNRWLAGVLDGRSAEGIQWDSSCLEQVQPQDQPSKEIFAADDASTVELLRTACELYMARCERLQETNTDLTTQVEELKTQLKEALVRAFASRQALDREEELSELRGRRIVAELQQDEKLLSTFHMIEAASGGSRESTDERALDDSVLASDVKQSEIEVEESIGSVHDGTDDAQFEVDQAGGAGRGSREDTLSTLVNEDKEPPLLEVFVPSKVELDAESWFDYNQLTQLKPREDNGGRWYRQALHSLKKGHKQRRLHREHGKSSFKAATKEVPLFGSREFEMLVAAREPAQDGEDLTWYRRALQHLKHERKSRENFRDRLESFSSTISFVE